MAPPSLGTLRTGTTTAVARLPTIVSPDSPGPGQLGPPGEGDDQGRSEEGPLFLSIDSGTKSMRGLVIDELGTVEWIGEVSFDELGFG